jgi:hypothetical protein
MVKKTTLILAFLVAAVLAGLYVQYGPSGVRESFAQKEVGKPLNAQGMGPYDEVSIAGSEGWASSEPLPVGSSPANVQNDPNKLMVLANNKVSPDCCPSAFNNDMGCICLTDSDKQLFASRGGNRA